MEKRGSDEAGSAALGVVAFCYIARWLNSAKPRTHRTQALGDRALPDLQGPINQGSSAADPETAGAVEQGFKVLGI